MRTYTIIHPRPRYKSWCTECQGRIVRDQIYAARSKQDQCCNTPEIQEENRVDTRCSFICRRNGKCCIILMDAASLGLAFRDCKERGFSRLTYAAKPSDS